MSCMCVITHACIGVVYITHKLFQRGSNMATETSMRSSEMGLYGSASALQRKCPIKSKHHVVQINIDVFK